ncbi:MAG TPA: hypothetical protein VL651_05795 [Bacteroidia bacterium]|nr:hypothetical protein [Bacteroidia bacterium]
MKRNFSKRKTFAAVCALILVATCILSSCKAPDHCDGLNKNLSSNPTHHRNRH